jgi:hypothetical protein|uniref:Uncharacterized protein n=1 Tax=Siphoviridae sp. ctAUQ2 TaxID=2826182 RepID=A0A8S5MYW6_9CAUD|nr:MAG TPA: hypothetical protein [Siphoviridae sp. ctAUQ2]
MNRRNNWSSVLKEANSKLSKYNARLEIEKDGGENTYSLFFINNNSDGTKYTEAYASGYYEEELEGLIEDAFCYAEDFCLSINKNAEL